MAVDVTAGRLALWRFQNGSLSDSSGNNRNLTMVGTVTPAIDKDGIANNAMNFAGVGNYLEVPFTLSPVNTAISLWRKNVVGIDGIDSIDFAVGIKRQDNPGKGFAITFAGNNTIQISKQDVDNIISYSDNDISGWVHYFACYINDRFRLYRNGIKVGEKVSTLGVYSSTVNKISIGKVFDYNRDSNDLMDEISIYDLPTGTNTDALALEIYNMGVNYEVDITPPTFNTINTSNITPISIDLNINCSENATAYYKLYDRGATAPTPDELKTTHDGIIALTANNLITKNITGLTALKDYDLYVVAEDTVGNLQTAPSLLLFNASFGKVATPTTDSPSGTYENGKIVTLNCATPGAEIRFTIDGSEPTEISQLYLTPLEVAKSKQVKVKAYKAGYFESDTLTLNYIIIGGNSMLGLPTVLILFKTALSQAIEQGETGVLAVILKDASVTAGVKEYKMTISTDIPSALSDDNKKALQLAFEGKPKMVKAVVIPATATDYTAGLEYLEAIEFNVMTIPYIETADVNAVKLWAIGVYENKSTKIIAVLPKSAADHPAVVNWTQDDIVSSTYSDTDMDANESIAGIAGLIAGLPLTIAPTYQMPTWIDDAPKMTEAQANTRVGAGELFIYSKQGKNKVARGVTSLITPTTTYPEQFKKIKLVRIYNKIYTDLKSTIEDYYIGKVQNSYDNIVQLINVVNGYFELLEQVPILEARQNSCEIDVASKKAYLKSVGVDTSKLTEQQIKEYNAGDKVFLKCTISALDSMETFNITINI